jgi:hypothetical protein
VEIGLAQHDRSSIDQRTDDGGVFLRSKVAKRRCSRGGREILRVDAVFDWNRQTVERAELRSRAAPPIGGTRRLKHPFPLQCDGRVERLAAFALRQQRRGVSFGRDVAPRERRYRVDR